MDTSGCVATLIPCAGFGERFRKDGSPALAKHLLPVTWRGLTCPMVRHVIRSLPASRGIVILGVRASAFEESYCIPARTVVVEYSRGQADTLRQMLESDLASGTFDAACVVVNCDALISSVAVGYILQAVMRRPHAYCSASVVQRSSSNGMSYVDSVPHPTRFAEKEPISSFGMSGAWAFRSKRELLAAIQTSMALSESCRGEVYLSHAMNHLQGEHLALQIEPMDVVDWNTPESLAASGAAIVW
jgi:hypothetical protein